MGNTPRPADTGIAPGMVLLGKYRVDRILGQGGMGVVAACTHLALNERVAVKMLRPEVLDHDAVSRFMREAQAAVKLRSEFVARVLDVGKFENEAPYMVMEYLEGHDLGELLDQRGTLAIPWATELVLQAAEALAEAHSLGIVHRDIKPTNLFVTWRPDGSAIVKVLDFGISKAPNASDMQLTQTQSLLGTPAYMSPEQMRSARTVDARTDIWSLGTVLYELIEGRRPFEAESFSEMCVKVAVDTPAAMVHAPPALQTVIMRCLAKSPEHRYANMGELGRELVAFAQDAHGAQVLVERMQRMHVRSQVGIVPYGASQVGVAALSQPGPVAPAVSQPRVHAPTELVQAPAKKRPWALIVTLCALVGAGLGLVIALSSSNDATPAAVAEPAPAPTPTPPPAPMPAPVTPPVVQTTHVTATPVETAKPTPAKPTPKREKPSKPAAEPTAAPVLPVPTVKVSPFDAPRPEKR